MAQTLEEILRDILGQQIIQIAALTIEVQRLREQLPPTPLDENQPNA